MKETKANRNSKAMCRREEEKKTDKGKTKFNLKLI